MNSQELGKVAHAEHIFAEGLTDRREVLKAAGSKGWAQLCIMPSQMDLTPNGVARLRIILSQGTLPSCKPRAGDTDPIKVGILHSLSGTMAISETSLKDVALMTIEEINNNGGVMGRKIEPIVVDPASNWPLFAEKARQLLTQDKVAVYPRTTNKILRAFLHAKGVQDADIAEVYTPFGHSDYQNIVNDIKKFAQGGKTAVISTINGDSNVPFYMELGNQGLKATEVPVVAFSVDEEELRGIDD